MISPEIYHPESLISILSFSLIMSYYLGRDRHVGPYWACFFVVFLTPVIGFAIILLSGKVDKKILIPSKYKMVIGLILSYLSFLLLIFLFFSSINDKGFFTENFLAFLPSIGIFGLGIYWAERGRGKSMNKNYNNGLGKKINSDYRYFFDKLYDIYEKIYLATILIISGVYFLGAPLGGILATYLNLSKPAEPLYRSVIFLDKNHSEANLGLGHLYFDSNKFEESIIFYDNAIKRKPRRAKNYYWRGGAKYFLGKYEDALLDFEITIDKGYANKVLYYKKGHIHERLFRYNEAIDDYYSAIELDSSYYRAYAGLARIKRHLALIVGLRGSEKCFKDDLMEKSLKYIGTAIQLDKDTTSLYLFYLRGLINADADDHQAALSDFSIAIDKKTNDKRVYFQRGKAKHILGDTKGACEDWITATEMGHEEAKQYLLKYCEDPDAF